MEGERDTRGKKLEFSSKDTFEVPNSTELIELAGEETQVLPVPTNEGTYEVTVAGRTEPVVIILEEFLSIGTGVIGPVLP